VIDLADGAEDVLAASGLAPPTHHRDDPNAVSVPDLDGSPDEAVPLANDAVAVNDAADGEERQPLIGSAPTDLSEPADDDERE